MLNSPVRLATGECGFVDAAPVRQAIAAAKLRGCRTHGISTWLVDTIVSGDLLGISSRIERAAHRRAEDKPTIPRCCGSEPHGTTEPSKKPSGHGP